MVKILIVDDCSPMQAMLADVCQQEGWNNECVATGEEALETFVPGRHAAVILDNRLPGLGGLEVLQRLKEVDPALIVVMLTAYGDVSDAVAAMKLGAADYLTKPFDNERLAATLRKALEHQQLAQEVRRLRKVIGEDTEIRQAMGESFAIRQVLKQVDVIAPTELTVLVQGESGTGKEVIANLIHRKSRRIGKPIVALDCGTIPETLAESEFFGYEKGAFSGATSATRGKFEQADGGTLFLDEVANLPMSAQAALLRVIQERHFQRLGGSRRLKLDVRILAASNINLQDAVRQGAFRQDLYHRLNEFLIELPRLQERRDDIPILADRFLGNANVELHRRVKRLSPAAIEILQAYEWPGNVRELRNVIRRAVLMTEGPEILPAHLQLDGSDLTAADLPTETPSLRAAGQGAMEDTERRLICQALEATNGNRTAAARRLGIHRSTLHKRLKQFGLD